MIANYNPADWYWIVGGDLSRAWSSAAGAWVSIWPADRVTRIGSAAELRDVLAPHERRAPVVIAEDVRAEASRRMQRLLGARDAQHLEILIANGLREAVRLLRVKEERPWTEHETERAAQLAQIDAAFEAVRAASNAMEGAPPEDYRNDARWP